MYMFWAWICQTKGSSAYWAYNLPLWHFHDKTHYKKKAYPLKRVRGTCYAATHHLNKHILVLPLFVME